MGSARRRVSCTVPLPARALQQINVTAWPQSPPPAAARASPKSPLAPAWSRRPPGCAPRCRPPWSAAAAAPCGTAQCAAAHACRAAQAFVRSAAQAPSQFLLRSHAGHRGDGEALLLGLLLVGVQEGLELGHAAADRVCGDRGSCVRLGVCLKRTTRCRCRPHLSLIWSPCSSACVNLDCSSLTQHCRHSVSSAAASLLPLLSPSCRRSQSPQLGLENLRERAGSNRFQWWWWCTRMCVSEDRRAGVRDRPARPAPHPSSSQLLCLFPAADVAARHAVTMSQAASAGRAGRVVSRRCILPQHWGFWAS